MILIVGANGFIGRKLVEKISLTQQLLALDKQISYKFNNNVQTLLCDTTHLENLEEVFKQYPIDTVVHLASLLNSNSNQNPSLATQVNILGSLNLLNLSRKYKISKFIYGSSISVYGPLPSSYKNPVNESVIVNPCNLYGDTKRYVESLGKAFKANYGLKFVSLRIATVIGKGVKNSSSPWRSQIFDNQNSQTIEIPLRIDEKLPMVHVLDVVDQIEILVNRNPFHDVYNTPSESISLGDVASIVNRIYPHTHFVFGSKKIEDIPHYIDGNLFKENFNYTLPSFAERLLIK